MKLGFDCDYQYDDGFELELKFQTEDPCTVLFGPSGSGKTTVLSLIAGMLNPERGQISLGERVLVDTESKLFVAPEKRSVGYVFQEPLLFPHLTVRGNLEFGQKFRGPSKQVLLIEDVARVFRILDLLDRRPASLSGGEMQRVALGRAIASGPELLLMDEPLTSLDDGLKHVILDYLKTAIVEWEIPVVYVTHSSDEVSRIADRRLSIEQGRLIDVS